MAVVPVVVQGLEHRVSHSLELLLPTQQASTGTLRLGNSPQVSLYSVLALFLSPYPMRQ